jgi:DNA-binding NarL/FixJ family response regulator
MTVKVMQGAIRIGLVADEPLRVAGLVSIFEYSAKPSERRFIPIAASADELLADPLIEYILIDLQGPTGFESFESIRKLRPNIRIIVIGPEGNDELLMNFIASGARGYLDLTAGPEMVRLAIEVVASGTIWAPRRLLSQLIDRLLTSADSSLTLNPKLTERERQVLDLIREARSNKEIASAIGIEERTVKAYVSRLMRKTGADNRIKLTISALGRERFPEKGEESGPRNSNLSN